MGSGWVVGASGAPVGACLRCSFRRRFARKRFRPFRLFRPVWPKSFPGISLLFVPCCGPAGRLAGTVFWALCRGGGFSVAPLGGSCLSGRARWVGLGSELCCYLSISRCRTVVFGLFCCAVCLLAFLHPTTLAFTGPSASCRMGGDPSPSAAQLATGSHNSQALPG